MLMVLNLEPIRPMLRSCYAPKPKGGRVPYDPVVMLRDLLAMHFCGFTSFNKWTKWVRAIPELAQILGFQDGSPSASTRYDFCYRLLDGPPSAGTRPSSLFRRPRHLRSLKNDASKETYDEPLANVLHKRFNLKKEEPLPESFATRILQILGEVAVKPSLERGFLREPFDIAMDGSLVHTQASSRGCGSAKEKVEPDKNLEPVETPSIDAPTTAPEKEPPDVEAPASQQPSSETIDPPKPWKKEKKKKKEKKAQTDDRPVERYYSDPTARWGYCASKEEYVSVIVCMCW